MKGLLCVLFLCASAFPAWANDGEENALSLAEAVAEVEDSGREVYLVVTVGSSIEAPNADFSQGMGMARGTVPVNNKTLVNDLGGYLGYELAESDKGSLNFEGGLSAGFFGLGKATFSQFDYDLPMATGDINDQISASGNIFMVGPEGGILYSHKGPGMGLYTGASIGLSRYSINYSGGILNGPSLSFDDYVGWTPVTSFKIGAVIDDIFRIGAEYSRTGKLNSVTRNLGDISGGPVHSYKIEAAIIFSR